MFGQFHISSRVFIALAVLVALLSPATTHATCAAGPAGIAIWPQSGATDVEVDTPIVVARYVLDGDTNSITTTLASADGTVISLAETRRLPPAWRGCGAAELVFLRPEEKLKSGTTYALRFRIADKEQAGQSTFTVGERASKPEPALHPDVTYLRVYTAPECVHEPCMDYANLRVDLGEPPSRPLWLRMQSSMGSHGWTFYPEGWSGQKGLDPALLSAAQLSLPVTHADECVDIAIYGVDGRALFEAQRCKPDRCAIYGIVAARSSGGSPGGSPVEVERIADGTCDDTRPCSSPGRAGSCIRSSARAKRQSLEMLGQHHGLMMTMMQARRNLAGAAMLVARMTRTLAAAAWRRRDPRAAAFCGRSCRFYCSAGDNACRAPFGGGDAVGAACSVQRVRAWIIGCGARRRWLSVVYLGGLSACAGDKGMEALAASGVAGVVAAPSAGVASAAGSSGSAGRGNAVASGVVGGGRAAVGGGGTTAAGSTSAGSGANPGAAGSSASAAGSRASTPGSSTSAPGSAGSNPGAAGSGSGAAGSRASSGAAGSSGTAADSGSKTSGLTPVYRIPLRVHTAMSELTKAELGPILHEMNAIWLEQASICFEIEVTASETNREDGFDFRYTSGEIPIARGSNGVFQDAHAIWSIDHPRLNDVSKPVMQPTARTTAHELGHALGLAHENPPPSNDCSRPCHCVELGDDCDEYLMRSGTKGFFLSMPEIKTTRERAPRVALSDQAPKQCGEPIFMP